LLRKLLSLVVVEIISYVNQIFWHVFSECGKETPSGGTALSGTFIVLCVNDMVTLIEMMSQLEAQYAPLILEISAHAQAESSRLADLQRAGALLEDAYALEEAEEAQVCGTQLQHVTDAGPIPILCMQQDLDAIRQDLPRVRAELHKYALQLVGLLVDACWADVKATVLPLFTPRWESDDYVRLLFSNLESKLHDTGIMIDADYFTKFASWFMNTFVAYYFVLLVNPSVATSLGVKYNGGFNTKFKLTPARLTRLAADELRVRQLFLRYLPREIVQHIIAPMHAAISFLTYEADILAEVLEAALNTNNSSTLEGAFHANKQILP
jgi:hypothetical protein